MRKYFVKYISILMTIIFIASITGCSSSNNNSASDTSSESIDLVESIMTLKESERTEGYSYYMYNALEDRYRSIRSDVLTPKYYIFAGNKTEEATNKLIVELGLVDNVREWAGEIYVINPLDGEVYGDKDKEAFIDLVGGAINNVKVIGIEEGATFVNNYISQSCYFIAGMMIYGGEMSEELELNDVVPVYISNSTDVAQEYYKKINNVTTEQKKDRYVIHENSDNKLQRTVVASNDESLSEAFNNAWESVFSRNYRQHNATAEFYMVSARSATGNYELIEAPIFEELGITYNQEIDQSVTGMDGKYTWFEYVPNSVQLSEDKSVPLIVNLHGNQNDPRLQGDSTGWPELASEENFIVIAPEWQEKEVNFFGCDGLGGDGVINLINDLQVKYSQIDPAKIYLTGLSAGGAESFLLGLQYSDIFAAVGIVGGVNVFADQVTEVADNYSGGEVPLLYLCGDHDFFQMIPVDGSSKYGTAYLFGNQIWDEDENTHIFSSLQAYQKINGLDVSEMNMSLNEYYGIALDNQGWTTLGNKEMYTGTLSNENGVVMELAAIKDLAHWNYKPQARYLWDFFSSYSRNTESGELIFED